MNNTIKYDVHLSAEIISQNSIKKIENLGFSRDTFTNNTRCEATAYHGTYRGEIALPSNDVWAKALSILLGDKAFRGGLEEEVTFSEYRRFFTGGKELSEVPAIKPFSFSSCPPNIHKTCDIHLNVDWSQTDENAKNVIEQLKMISFDRPNNDGFNRIYTLTFRSLKMGIDAFYYLETVCNSLPCFFGKLKLEHTTRYVRYPDNAINLPIIL